MTELRLALDRASVRKNDEDGHLHVKLTPISKANVCGYLGREIPKWQELGLAADKIYKLYRDPAELEKAADTFNGKPLLFGHKPISAEDHDHERTVGSVTGVVWKAPYLMAALDIWPSKAIDAIESGEHEQLSSAYRYTADMTPGTTPDGEKYHGVMRDISANHVALVPQGRAGKDVLVHDRSSPKLKELFMKPKSATLSVAAVAAQIALLSYARPRIAQDVKLDLTPMLKGVTSKTIKAKAPTIAKAFDAVLRPNLARDAEMDQSEVQDIVEQIAEVMKDESDNIAAAVSEPGDTDAKDAGANWAEVSAFLEGKISDDDMAKLKAMFGGDDEGSAEDRRKKGVPVAPSAASDKGKEPVPTKAAMDAALADVATKIKAEQVSIREAERFVRPFVGEIALACDSAEAVHRAALDILNVKHEGKHPDALADLVEVHGQALKAKAEPRRFAQDAAPAGVPKYDAVTFPNANRLK